MKNDLMGEINITPLTDIMLVLLIVFLLLMGGAGGIKAQNPGSKAKSLLIKIDQQGTIGSGGIIFKQDAEFTAFLKNCRQKPLNGAVISAEKSLPYSRVLKILTLTQEAGFSEIALTCPEE